MNRVLRESVGRRFFGSFEFLIPPDSPIYQYVLKNGSRSHPVLQRLHQVSRNHPMAIMASPPDQVAMLQFLLKLIGAKKIIEIGTFTGYTTLGMALALPDDGKVIALDVSKEYADIGKPFWEEAGVAHKVDLRIRPAVDSLDQLLANNEAGTFDLVMIDADKPNYINYYEKSLQLLRKDGIVAVDNTLWGGQVIDKSINDASTKTIRQLNEFIKTDDRIDFVMLTVSDGVTLVRKK